MAVKKATLLTLAILMPYIIAPSPVSALDCTVTSGACSGTIVFGMYNLTNSNAGLFTGTLYPYNVCCTDPSHILTVSVLTNAEENLCDPLKQGRILALYRENQSHAENYGYSTYGNNLCLSSNSGNITCEYRYQDNCNGGETCLASVSNLTNSNITNAHVGDCSTSGYKMKICCKLIGGPSVVFEEPEGDLSIRVGEQGTILLKLTNSLNVPDTFTIGFSGTPSKIGYWSWFSGHRYDEQKMETSVTIGPEKSANVAIIVFGGEVSVSVSTIYVKVKSAATGMSTELSKNVYINYGPEGMFTQTPEFGWAEYMIIGLIGAFLLI